MSEVNHLAEIAKIGNARIQVLIITENGLLSPAQKRNKILLQKYFNDIDHKFNLIQNVKTADALSCFVEFNASNLISYIDMKSSLWKQLGFGEPTLGNLGYYENVPVLALRE